MATTNAQIGPTYAYEKHLNDCSIKMFFAEKVILLTGATGFVGKALLEKLLRTCPAVTRIFVLIRPRTKQSIEERFNKLLENPIFDKIRCDFPDVLNKVFLVKGDLGLPDIGLHTEDKEMLIQSVNVVFHSAATVRFVESLKVAVNLNTKGTDRLLDLCKCMRNLVSVVHVSTAYSNADRREIEESIYTTNVKPHTVIDMCENLDDATLEILEKRLIGKHPNTYTLTKNWAEQIVLSKGRNMPIAIVRPSIVGAAYQEPFPGWIDNVCGITGIMTEIGRGTVRSIVCNKDLIVDMIPVDFVVDTLICAAWYNSVERTDTVKIYNCVSSPIHPITWRKVGNLTRKYAIESPSKYVMWYPDFTFRTNRFIHYIVAAALHFLPAFIVDVILRVQGSRPIMMQITKRFERAAKNGEFFAMNEWKFHADNMKKLKTIVKESENCNHFNVDIRSLDWDKYMQRYILGIRTYIMKDSLDTLSNARNRLSKLYWIQKITKLFSIFLLIRLIKLISK
ncbi:putative fatty acyl-CoA reductase CG5065 [Pseudomyrmex gracilis]|uniref:putative fatty acyl-CoA reductase CG5065 n=1 Tax=Pseudomyrmex gracilis TaxID=219809 RepID=UPI000995D056|nr:putative fatty acyl-CoA reductase CG5065 [Pseudomyrmex gracilis]XP_020291382.1 putative fatty acyl-CoA reductase CG5065 [Pseudomyrmex gracilis]XP_020291383.1 putative fatty acyl-CoA reductase CG5065 [Pseudomyrmex gracilis]XP_020291384.1 putative fatty acyl-CoA reductase CG5065 [Pseudomyrmex gracilis]